MKKTIMLILDILCILLMIGGAIVLMLTDHIVLSIISFVTGFSFLIIESIVEDIKNFKVKSVWRIVVSILIYIIMIVLIVVYVIEINKLPGYVNEYNSILISDAEFAALSDNEKLKYEVAVISKKHDIRSAENNCSNIIYFSVTALILKKHIYKGIDNESE